MEEQLQRLDKWLWCARFFKTRGLAAAAIKSGHVEVNGVKAKPGRALKINDLVRIKKTPYVFELRVQELASRRGPQAEASGLYVENVESINARNAVKEQLAVDAPSTPRVTPGEIIKERPA